MVAYELAVEQTEHLGVGEGMSCGLINSLANTLGFIYVLALTPVLEKTSESASMTAMFVLFASLVVAIILIITVKIVKKPNGAQK